MELILAVGYSHSEFKILQDTAPKDIVYEYVESPASLETLLREKECSCILCSANTLDSVSYVYAMRNIRMIPIIIGEVRHHRNISALKNHISAVMQYKSIVEVGAVTMDFDRRIVSVCDHKINLTAIEFDILSLLISNPGRVFTYGMIVDIVWNEDCTFYSKKVVHNHVSNINKKFRTVVSNHKYIISIHGVGYKFVAE